MLLQDVGVIGSHILTLDRASHMLGQDKAMEKRGKEYPLEIKTSKTPAVSWVYLEKSTPPQTG